MHVKFKNTIEGFVQAKHYLKVHGMYKQLKNNTMENILMVANGVYKEKHNCKKCQKCNSRVSI